VRPKTHFTALFKAQVIVMALSGMTVTAIAGLIHETDTRIWKLLGKAVTEARDAADYSDVVRVSIDDTAKRRNQSYISIMANLDCQRAVAVTQGRDRGLRQALRRA
jgi:transposase